MGEVPLQGLGISDQGVGIRVQERGNGGKG